MHMVKFCGKTPANLNRPRSTFIGLWIELAQVTGLVKGCFRLNIFVELITHPFAH